MMMCLGEKQCFKCQRILPLSEFYRHPKMLDGHLNKCKECTKCDVRRNYRERIDQYLAYDKQRSQQPERREYAKLKQAKRRLKDPEKYRARTAVGNAVRDRILMRKACERCGSTKAQAHHMDYSRPLDVQWLCFRCHRKFAHGQMDYVA